jgi:hypothetical protein
MIPTISFVSLAEWILGAYVAGCFTGAGFMLWLYNRAAKKK